MGVFNNMRYGMGIALGNIAEERRGIRKENRAQRDRLGEISFREKLRQESPDYQADLDASRASTAASEASTAYNTHRTEVSTSEQAALESQRDRNEAAGHGRVTDAELRQRQESEGRTRRGEEQAQRDKTRLGWQEEDRLRDETLRGDAKAVRETQAAWLSERPPGGASALQLHEWIQDGLSRGLTTEHASEFKAQSKSVETLLKDLRRDLGRQRDTIESRMSKPDYNIALKEDDQAKLDRIAQDIASLPGGLEGAKLGGDEEEGDGLTAGGIAPGTGPLPMAGADETSAVPMGMAGAEAAPPARAPGTSPEEVQYIQDNNLSPRTVKAVKDRIAAYEEEFPGAPPLSFTEAYEQMVEKRQGGPSREPLLDSPIAGGEGAQTPAPSTNVPEMNRFVDNAMSGMPSVAPTPTPPNATGDIDGAQSMLEGAAPEEQLGADPEMDAQTRGLPDDLAQTVRTQAERPASTHIGAPPADERQEVINRIAADVQSGKLSREDVYQKLLEEGIDPQEADGMAKEIIALQLDE